MPRPEIAAFLAEWASLTALEANARAADDRLFDSPRAPREI